MVYMRVIIWRTKIVLRKKHEHDMLELLVACKPPIDCASSEV